MTKTMMIASILCGLTACAVDGEPDHSSAPTVDPVFSTVLDKCATGDNANATTTVLDFQDDTYTRTATTIDTTCGCAAWQVDMNANGAAQANQDYPSCRPWTYFDVAIQELPSNDLGANVSNWGTTSKTECENSELDLSIEENVNGTWIAYWPTTLNHFYVFHPTFDATTGSCNELDKAHTVTGAGNYRVKARAIRGLDQYNHGYAGVVMTQSGTL